MRLKRMLYHLVNFRSITFCFGASYFRKYLFPRSPTTIHTSACTTLRFTSLLQNLKTCMLGARVDIFNQTRTRSKTPKIIASTLTKSAQSRVFCTSSFSFAVCSNSFRGRSVTLLTTYQISSKSIRSFRIEICRNSLPRSSHCAFYVLFVKSTRNSEMYKNCHVKACSDFVVHMTCLPQA